MATDSDDLFGRSGNLLSSTASPTGGVWGRLTNGFTDNTPTLNGDVVTFNEFDPNFFYNSVAQTGNQSTVTMTFTPYSDNWQAAVHLRVQGDGFTCYQLLFGPGAGVISKRTSSSQTWHGTQLGSTATNVNLPASHRSQVTLAFSVSSAGVLTGSVNGTGLDFGGTVSEGSPLGTGGYGLGGRAHSATRILGEGTAAGDTTAPVLTSPTGTSTGSTTASGTVSTDEANGTLYRFASQNATETAATVKAANLTQTVTATGAQAVTFTGLTAGTTYYAHYVHRDAAGNDSARVSSSSFTTSAGDTTAPTLTSPTGTSTGATTATGTVSTNEANGTLYYVTTINATETAATVKAGSSQSVTATGSQSISRTGLTPSTTYRHHYVHRDAAGNDSTVASSATFTTSAASGGTLTLTTPLCNNTGLISGRWISQAGITLTILSESTKTSVLVVTGRATDASGVLTAAITDASITTGQSYRIVPSFGGNVGVTQVLTAT